jgi:isoprenylcysteine carboxyl methyltransferase (ICMT) family protein YpbQ
MIVVIVAVVIAWAIAEGAMAGVDRVVERGTLALPTGVALLAGQVGGAIENGDGAAWGVALIAVGAALRVTAIVQLGGGFRTRLDSPTLVTTGVYRWLRHPSEYGLILIAAGGAVALASWIAAIAACVVAALSVVRCRREDAALRRTHGDAHAAWSPVL